MDKARLIVENDTLYITVYDMDDLYYEELMKRVATSKTKEKVKRVITDTAATFAGMK